MLRPLTLGEQSLLRQALLFQADQLEINGLKDLNLTLFEDEVQAINENARKALSGMIEAHIDRVKNLRTLAELVDRYELMFDTPIELPELA